MSEANDTVNPFADLPPDWRPGYSTCDDVSVICPVEASLYGDYFNLGACIFFVVAHTLLAATQAYFAYRSRAWSFAIWLGLGTLFEVMGYGARIALSQNPWIYEGFVIQLLMLILGPTLIAASISITFKHLVLWYGPEWSFLKPKLYPWVFVGTDFISIFIQAAGGGVSATATSGGETTNRSLFDVGSGMLVAGVIFQLVNMVFCGGLMLMYMFRRRKALKNGAAGLQSSPVDTGAESSDGSVQPAAGASKGTRPEDKKVRIFIWAISVAYVAIIIRCIYRIPEMQLGWGSELMQNETTFLILDGGMVLLAVTVLTAFHPLFFFPFLSSKNKAKTSEAPTQEVEAGATTATVAEGDETEMREVPNATK